MCWDISLHTDIAIIKKQFPQLQELAGAASMQQGSLSHVQAVAFPDYPILFKENGILRMQPMAWGVLPTYITDPKLQTERRLAMVNVRSERILGDKKSYWNRLREQRCLIPVSGTFEHRKVAGWKKKVPYYITERDRPICYIPGLYQWHEVHDSKGLLVKSGSFGMLTREANGLMAQIHNDGPNKCRMPLFLPPELAQMWLSDLPAAAMLPVLAYEMPSAALCAYPVYTLRGSVDRPDEKQPYEPFNWPGLPELGQSAVVQRTLF